MVLPDDIKTTFSAFIAQHKGKIGIMMLIILFTAVIGWASILVWGEGNPIEKAAEEILEAEVKSLGV